MLRAWDEPLSGWAYAPAYVLLGAEKALDAKSRQVQIPADMASRRDPHPEIWNERPDLVRRIFASVRSSVETLTWAYQVLASTSGTLELSLDSIGMALETTYPPLRRTACTALPHHVEIFNSLSTPQWISFFQNAIDDEVAQVTDALTAEPHARVGEALANVMVQPGEVTDRSARLAVLYMVAPRTRLSQHPGADAAALVAVIERFQLEYRALWAPVAARMTPQELIGVYRTLTEHDAADASLESIADEVVKKTWLAPDLALECVGSENPKVVELGWRLVEANGGNSFFFDRVLKYTRGSVGGPAAAQRIVSRAIQQASSTLEAVQLATWALATKIDRSALAASLSETPAGRAALWEMSADVSDAAASTLASATPEVVRAVGDALVPQQLPVAEPNQLALVRSYLRKNPERVRRDAPFGVAALESSDPALQMVAIRQLATARHLPAVWLTLAESGLPRALAAARKYTAALKDVGQTRDAILACLDSDDHAVQDIGTQLFQERQTLAMDPQIWAALAKSDDDHAQELVAEAALTDKLVDERLLSEFDRRVLSDRRPRRRAKELIKKRLEKADRATTSVPKERIAGLLTMTRGPVAQDREWALMRLAALALRGVPIEGFEFSLTTIGTVVAADLTP